MSFTSSVVATKPIDGQKTGTSGLRKPTTVFMSEHYLQNWVQSLFNACGAELAGKTLVVGGDGRFWTPEAAQIIIGMAAAAGVARVVVGQNAILSTPVVSCIVRKRSAYGAVILTASHNPGGIDHDFGIKWNVSNGAPAPEKVTNAIYEQSIKIASYTVSSFTPALDLCHVGEHAFSNGAAKFTVEVIDSCADYLELMSQVFDFASLKALLSRPDFRLAFDALNGVTGPYARRILVETLGAPESSLRNCTPLPDFGGHHPDPNLTYAADLVAVANSGDVDFAAASDGDGDRNMVLGRRFFVNPCDSLAIIVAWAPVCIPYFQKRGIAAIARSMPTSGAVDRVAQSLNLAHKLFETPTGWKFFESVMESHTGVICGEESFGQGSDHIREKDGMWAVLAWLSILSHAAAAEGRLVSVQEIVERHWAKFGRNVFSRYDYEGLTNEQAAAVMKAVEDAQKTVAAPGSTLGEGYTVKIADNFAYTDPVDHSVTRGQGLRLIFEDGSRLVYRLSGTGSSGATVRIYFERYLGGGDNLAAPAAELLRPLVDLGVRVGRVLELTGREQPTVIT